MLPFTKTCTTTYILARPTRCFGHISAFAAYLYFSCFLSCLYFIYLHLVRFDSCVYISKYSALQFKLIKEKINREGMTKDGTATQNFNKSFTVSPQKILRAKIQLSKNIDKNSKNRSVYKVNK